MHLLFIHTCLAKNRKQSKKYICLADFSASLYGMEYQKLNIQLFGPLHIFFHYGLFSQTHYPLVRRQRPKLVYIFFTLDRCFWRCRRDTAKQHTGGPNLSGINHHAKYSYFWRESNSHLWCGRSVVGLQIHWPKLVNITWQKVQPHVTSPCLL